MTTNLKLGEMGKNLFREVMGIARDKRFNDPQPRIVHITRRLDALESLGMTPERLSSLQERILDFANAVLYTHYRLNNDKRALQANIDASGLSPETFDRFKQLSLQYVTIRNLTDCAFSFIDRMHEHIYTRIDSAIDDLAPDNITERKMARFNKDLKALSDFNERISKVIDRHYDEVDARLLSDESSNYLLYCRQSLEAQWDVRLQEYRDNDTYLTDKFCAKSDLLLNANR